MNGLPPVAVVVVSYASSALLATNLVAVARACPDARVVVVDNFTSDAEREAVERLCADHGWRLVASPTNVGFGVGMNLGVAAARADGAEHLLLLNPDARIEGPDLDRLRAAVAAAPLTMVGPVIETPEGRVWSDGHDLYLDRGRMRATRRREGDPRVAPWLTGACLLLSGELWDLVGGFDERYFLYWEDVDLSWRVVEAGGALEVVRDAVAVHDEGGTQERLSSRALSTTYYYYNVRNRLVFAGHHLSRRDRWRWVATAVPEAYQVLLRGGRRQLLASPAPWRAAVTGTVAGLAGMRRPGTGRTHRTGRSA